MKNNISLGIQRYTHMLIFVILSGCATHYKEVEPTQWEQVHQDVKAILAIEAEFSHNHKFVGEVIERAIRHLKTEGFECHLTQKTFPTYAAADRNFGSEKRTLVYCWGLRADENRRVCEVMWASFDVNWNEPGRPSLQAESAVRSIIERERYFCGHL